MAKTERFSHPLNVLFDPDTKQKLVELTDNGRLSQGHVLRQLVHSAHAMKVQKIPTCADGGRCQCPHSFNVPRAS